MSTRLVKGGRLINRRRRLGFQFNGHSFLGYEGDSLASALLANDQILVGRSFKFHRPRGLVASGPEEPNGLVTVGEGGLVEPNCVATMKELHDGMKASSQNHFPSLEFDIGAVAGLAARLLPAGFYYKTFMQPRSLWKRLYEPALRHAAGLGKAPRHRDSSDYEHFHAHVDLLVVGGGAAGLLAAQAAAERGAQVLIVEQMPFWGGRSAVDHAMIDGIDSNNWIAQYVKSLEAYNSVHMLNRTTLFGVYDHGLALAVERVSDHRPEKGALRQRIWRIRPRQIILATGAIERPICFQQNDTPGVMLASAARDYVKNYGVSPGDRTVIAVNNDDGYRTALALSEAGLEVPAVLDSRPRVESELLEDVHSKGIHVEFGRAVAAVQGGKRVTHVQVCTQMGEGSVLREIACDSVSMSGGWSPVVHLWSHCGGKLVWDPTLVAFRPDLDFPPINSAGHAMAYTAGAVSGCPTLQQTLEDAAMATEMALESIGLGGRSIKRITCQAESFSEPSSDCLSPSGIQASARDKIWVDFQNDVRVSDLDLAVQENYAGSEHAKRYTTLGMATDQGKLSNINGLMIMARNRGIEPHEAGVTTFRPPYTAVTFGAIAGDRRGPMFKPVRKTPIDQWHEDNGAFWDLVGDWRRPYCYLKGNEGMTRAVERETLGVRRSAGLLDASTLGKMTVSGPDAGRFLDMIYTSQMSELAVGRCRYGLICDENGFLMDDGVIARISETSFVCHTTSSQAGLVHGWMEDWLQCEWPDWQVYTADLTEQIAQIVIAGPKARAILEKLGAESISNEALPHMAWSDQLVGSHKARIYRISYSGELSYEIAVPAAEGMDMWMQLQDAGQEFGLEVYGTEAMHVLRAEKGYILIGQESDGTITPQELGLDWAISRNKADFLGKRGQRRQLSNNISNLRLVGLETVDANAALPVGAQVSSVTQSTYDFPHCTARVTSSYHSPVLNRRIALGLVENGFRRMGEIIHFTMDDGEVAARIVSPVFYDPEGRQIHD